MEETQRPRRWYQKKRYIIPTGAVAAVLLFGGGSDSADVKNQAGVIDAVDSVIVPAAETKDKEGARAGAESFVPPVNEKEEPKAKKTEVEQAPAPRPQCHPSYSGCLKPNASDYDCASGSGNGPYYTGAVRVIGPDVFDLDRDNDGWGCE